jgi:chorismate mutase-like protein
MAGGRPSLESLRREIDGIDDEMQDLLLRRTEVVERIGAIKSREAARIYIRPAREATIMRRLVERHRGRLPAPAVVRIWREIIAATTLVQGPFSVAVHAPEGSVEFWDLARDHYGSCTQMKLHDSAKSAIRAVVDGAATVAVLALPEEGDPDPWWRMLVGAEERTPHIVARLPFIEIGSGRRARWGALAIAQLEHEKTGDDVSFLAIEASAELSRARLKEALNADGLPAKDLAAWQDAGTSESRLHLIEVGDFVGPGDARTAAVLEKMGDHVGRVIRLGGYALPLGLRDGAGNG